LPITQVSTKQYKILKKLDYGRRLISNNQNVYIDYVENNIANSCLNNTYSNNHNNYNNNYNNIYDNIYNEDYDNDNFNNYDNNDYNNDYNNINNEQFYFEYNKNHDYNGDNVVVPSYDNPGNLEKIMAAAKRERDKKYNIVLANANKSYVI